MSKCDLRVDWATHEAAKYAVENWHYSKSCPQISVSVGAWENGKYIGAICFGRGANNHIGTPFGLSQDKVCELVRVALKTHECPVSRICSIAVKFLKRQSPGLRLIISYADPEQSHHGGIYQAMNWCYLGKSQAQRECLINGKIVHKKTVHSTIGTVVGVEKSKILWKHKYALPLDAEMRQRILPLSKPYPKRASSADSGTPGNQLGGSGANPTDALQPCAGSIASDAPAFQAGEGGSTTTPALHPQS